MKRTTTLALAGALALAGCRDMGLEGNVPLAEAEQMPPSELVAAVHPARGAAEGHELILEGALWVPSGGPGALSSDALRPVGAAQGRTVYARTWDRPPYDELFTRVEGAAGEPGAAEGDWQSYLPVIGGGTPGAGPVDAGAAAEHGPGH
jgi:hypothetical protein